jgi:AcrR family transcriptional regulator
VKEARPRGESAVRNALISAASELFAARGVNAVSVREIAEHAGVNHGLVHHYFVSKDGLLSAVLDALAARAATELVEHRDHATIYAPGSAAAQHGRILGSMLLEGRDVTRAQSDFPTVHTLIARLRARGHSDREARERAAQITALVLGWQFFEPFLGAAANLRLSDRARTMVLDRAVDRLSDAG